MYNDASIFFRTIKNMVALHKWGYCAKFIEMTDVTVIL